MAMAVWQPASQISEIFQWCGDDRNTLSDSLLFDTFHFEIKWCKKMALLRFFPK